MQNVYKIRLDFCIMIEDTVKTWGDLAQPFQYSSANSLARDIILEGREDTKIGDGTARKVYSLGSYEADGEEHHAILKVYKKPANFHKVGFEALWMAVASHYFDSVGTPGFCFIPYIEGEVRKKFAFVTEDLSQGGKYQVSELEPESLLPFDTGKTYQLRLQKFLNTQEKIGSAFDIDATISLISSGRDELLKSTGLAIHDGKNLQSLAVADVDQLYGNFERFDSSMLLDLRDITFEL
jgi:hypothetical protein